MESLFQNGKRALFNICDDWVFHYLYARDTEDSRNALIAVLNTVLERIEDPIIEIEILNPEVIGEYEPGKDVILDIKAKSQTGELFDIEMQNGELAYYRERSLFYVSRVASLALEKGQKYDKMKKTIMISFINGKLFPETKKLHTKFQFREYEEGFLLSDLIEYHYIELSKLDMSKPVSGMSELERLATYFKCAGDLSKEDMILDLLAHGGDAITMTEKTFKTLTNDQKALLKQIEYEIWEHDQASLRAIEEERRMEEEKRREEDERRRREDELLRQEDERRRQQDELLRQEDERRRQQDELLRQEDERRRQQDELLRQEDERRRREDELLRQEDERRRREDELLRQEDEKRRRQDELRSKELDKREAELAEREALLAKLQAELSK